MWPKVPSELPLHSPIVYYRQARYFASRRLLTNSLVTQGWPQHAQVYLNLAVALDTSIERGPEDEESTIICSLMAARALALAKLGLFQQANQCAEVNLGGLHPIQEVLQVEPSSVKAILIKAESLYNTCDFERAMAFFCFGQRVAPGATLFNEGLEKCKKTIQGTLNRWVQGK